MAKTISQLPDATVVNGSDELIIQQSGVTKRATKTEVLAGIVNANIDANAQISHSKLANITAAQVLLGNASNVPTATAVTGDVTISNTGVTAIAAGSIVSADIADSAVTSAKIADSAVTSAKIADSAVTSAKIADSAVTSAKIANLTIVNDDIATNAAIAGTKIAPDFGSQSVVTTGAIQMNGTQSDYTAFVLNNTSGVQVHLNANANSEGNLRTVTNHPLSFSTNNTERMRIGASGNVGIGTSSPSAAAMLDVSSTTQGLLPPRMTTAQRDAITSPPAGLVLYNTSTNKLQVRTNTAWADLH